MVMVVSLVMVLSLVLVLLAELYCSLLFRRRRHNSLDLPITTTVSAAATTTTTLNQAISTTSNEPSPSPNPLYTGVLKTPTKTHFHHEPSSQASLDLIQETDSNHNKSTASGDNFIYISNPIYSNDVTSKHTTPFETPQSSPSRLEDDDDIIEEDSTPTLSPMKELPEKACSVSLKDIETSPSESNSNNNNNNGASSSSSGSPYTSPSW